MSEEEIKKEIEDLEKTVSKWRTGKPALPPELVNMVKEGKFTNGFQISIHSK